MTLQEQTCTREQGARLVELGVKPLATFYHMPAKDGPHGEYIQYGWHSSNLAPAFTVAELLDMLPEIFEGNTLSMVKGYDPYSESDCYTVGYREVTTATFNIGHGDTTAAIAAAGCLLVLLEKKRYDLPLNWKEDPANACHGGTCQRSYSPDMKEIQQLPVPSEEEIAGAAFEAVYQVLKGCTINMPRYFTGSQDINGCHVKLIIDAIENKHDNNAVPGA